MTSRREFLQMLSVAAGVSSGLAIPRRAEAAAQMMYDPPRFGNLSLLQIGDTHGQVLPAHVREASIHMGVGEYANQPPFLVGESFFEHYRVMPQTLRAHAHGAAYFADLAEIYGPTGGYAHLATALKYLRASRPDSLLLDCGDSWQGSGLALWSGGRALVEATRELGVDAMTGDWEFALGAERLREYFGGMLHGRTAFLGHNVHGADDSFRTPTVPYTIFFVGGTPVGVIGEAYPHGGTADSRNFGRSLRFGVDEQHLQDMVDTVRARGARVVVLLSHAGLPADLKLASRVRGIDVVLSGHSHDALPEPMLVGGRRGKTLVCSVGAHGKFVGVLDLDVRDGRLRDYRFRLIPIFSRMLPADPAMAALIERAREPFRADFERPVAVSEGLLFRRDNFMGSFDQVVLEALLAARDAEIAFAPGFRWGTTILPGQTISFEQVLDPLAVPDAGIRVETLSGREIRDRLESWLDDVFNPDPYEQTGDDMVRALGLRYACDPAAALGRRIGDVQVRGKPLDAEARYRVVSWGLRSPAPVENVPVWQVVFDYLRQVGRVKPVRREMPLVAGAQGNFGVE